MIPTSLAVSFSWINFVGPVVVTLTVAATVLWALAALATRLLRRSSAALRHQIWTTATLAVLLAPLLLPVIQRRLPRLAERPRAAAAPITSVAAPTVEFAPQTPSPMVRDVDRVELPVAPQTAPPQPTPAGGTAPVVVVASTRPFLATSVLASLSWRGLFVVLWSVGVVLQLVLFLRARLQVRAVLRRARDLGLEQIGLSPSRLLDPLHLTGPVRFCESSETAVPFVTGIVRPTVVLPTEARNWSPARLEAVLLHELLHVRRRDLLTQALARLAVALTWFHPLAWLALRRIRTEAEHATDDAVLTVGGCSPVDYAEHFLAIARQVARGGRPLPATMSMAGRSSVEVRLRSILDREVNRRPVRPAQFGLILPGAVAAIVATAWVAPGRAEPAPGRIEKAAPETTAPPAPPAEPKRIMIVAKEKAASAPTPTSDPVPHPGDAAIEEALRQLDRLDLKEPAPLREVLAELAWKHRLPVRLEEWGFSQSDCGSQILTAPVSLDEAPLRTLLMQLLEPHLKRGGEAYAPRLLVRDGMLGISAGEDSYAMHTRHGYPEMNRVTSIRGTVHRADGTPAVAARLEAWTLGSSTFAVADEKGEFAIPIHEGSRHRLLLFARGESGTSAMAALPDAREAKSDTPIQLVLEPSPEKEARVVDAGGEPVPGARVELIVSGRPISGQTTDNAGRLRLRFPAALPVEAILFWKRGAGFDYRRFDAEPYNARPVVRTFGQLAGELESTLAGAERTTFVLTDRQGQPLPGIRVRPSSVQFVKEAGALRLPELGELGDVTNAAGEVTFDWLPRVPSSMTRFYHTSGRHARHIFQELGGDELERRETVALIPKTRISGYVRMADGRPAPDASIVGIGGARNMFMGFPPGVTDERGAFAFYLEPGAQFMLQARSKNGQDVSPARDDLFTFEGKDLENVDFVLGPGTRLFGRLHAPEGTSASGLGKVSVSQLGRGLKDLPEFDLDSIPDVQEFIKPQINSLVSVRDDLTFEFFAGPGRYVVSPPRDFRHMQGNGPITVTDQKELQIDFRHEKWILAPNLQGSVVAGADRSPVPEARLRMIPRQLGLATPTAVADKEGRFEIQRESDQMAINVLSPDRKLGALQQLDSQITRVTISLSPTAAIRLRVLDDQGKPFAKKVIVRANFVFPQKASWSPDPPLPVKPDGTLEMTGLIVGARYQLQVSLDGGESFHPLASVEPEEVGPIDAGEFRVNLPEEN